MVRAVAAPDRAAQLAKRARSSLGNQLAKPGKGGGKARKEGKPAPVTLAEQQKAPPTLTASVLCRRRRLRGLSRSTRHPKPPDLDHLASIRFPAGCCIFLRCVYTNRRRGLCVIRTTFSSPPCMSGEGPGDSSKGHDPRAETTSIGRGTRNKSKGQAELNE